MDYASVLEYFLDSEFEVQPSSDLNQETLSVNVKIDARLVTLVHFCVDELQQLPKFYLADHASYGVLAHVLPSTNLKGYGFICVNHLDSLSVNFERPELVFEESIKRHVELLRSLISDAEFNQSELLREFNSNWNLNTQGLRGKSPKTLYCTSRVANFTQLDIYKPILKDTLISILASFTAVPHDGDDQCVARFFKIDSRELHKDAAGCILPLQSVNPVIPNDAAGLKTWLLDAIKKLIPETKNKLEKTNPIRCGMG